MKAFVLNREPVAASKGCATKSRWAGGVIVRCLAVAISLAVAGAVQADPVYWDGAGGTTELWGDVANWSTTIGGGSTPAAIPGASDVAVFYATSVSSNLTIQTRGDRSVQGLEFTTSNNASIRSNTVADQNSILTIGSSGITKTGTGAVTLAHTGATTTRRLDIALSADQTWQNNNATGNLTIGVLTTTADAAGTIKPTAGGGNRVLTLDGSNTTELTGMRLNSSLQNASATDVLSVVKQGAGTWTLSSGQSSSRGASTFTGGMTVKDGLLIALANSATLGPEDLLGKGVVTLEGGTVSFRALGSGTTAQTVDFQNNIAVAGTATIDVRRPSGSTANKTIALDKLTIGAGTLNVTGGGNGYNLRFAGATTLTGNATFNPTTSPLTLAGAIGETGGSRGLTMAGINALVLSGVNTYTGATTVNGGGTGFVRISADSGLGAAPGSPTASHLVLNAGGLNTTASFTLSANRGIELAGAGGLIFTDTATSLGYDGIMIGTNFEKTGTGLLTLGGANTYSGTTTVSAGGLIINGAHSGAGLATVASGARIGGTGSLAGGLTIASGGLFVFNPADPTLDVAGAVTLDNSFSVASLVNANGSVIDWTTVADGTYTLIGTTASSFANIQNFGAGSAATIGVGRTAYFTDGSLNLVIVPEPSTGLAVATGVGVALGCWRTRRRRSA
jgi:fibronectin-binding autotransporter adhesin